jgi:2-oxoisovalerate dehydrogenase E1 component
MKIKMQEKGFTEEIKEDYLLEAKKIRVFETLLLDLFEQGKISGTVHTCVGQELTGVVLSQYLEEQDHIVSNHRGHGHYLSRTKNYPGLLSELMGKESGCSKGVGGSQHTYFKNFLTNGIQGGMIPIATGIALNFKKSNKGISIAFIGDGTLGEGIIYEAINIAANWGLPLMIVIENNQYAQSTSFGTAFSGDIENRFNGFGADYFKCSTGNLEELDGTLKKAVNHCRSNSTPTVIEVQTYRLNSHSKGDDNRDQEEVEKMKSLDLINNWNPIESSYESLKEFESYLTELVEKIDTEPSVELGYFRTPYIENKKVQNSNSESSEKRYNKLLNEALEYIMETYPQSIMIGEDIEDYSGKSVKPYGGAFKVSSGLSTAFPGRVLNTPISEAAITGIISGYSMYAQRSIVEIMFGDFTTLILDQLLQHASKFYGMYGKEIDCPMIVRTPMGGKRGYGPTHSQSLEKFFLGIPHLGVVAFNHRISPKSILKAIYENYFNPFLLVENKILYTRNFDKERLPGFDYIFTDKAFPEIIIKPGEHKADITVFCYGDMLFETEQAAKELFVEHEILVQVVCISLISSPLSSELLDQIKLSRKIVAIEEGNSFNGWGTQIISSLCQKMDSLKPLIIGYDDIIPCNQAIELKLLPSKDLIVDKLNKFYNE